MSAPAPPPNDDVPVRPGTVVAGAYRVDRILGRGSTGVVVEARHVARDERVALKLLPELARSPEARERFVREGRAAMNIQGEHATRVSDVGVLEDGTPYLVREYLDGIDLAHALQKYGVCQIPDAIDYLLQACEAVAEAHAQGITVRDLKPASLFLANRPDGSAIVKVLDLAVSKRAAGGDDLARATASTGSAPYMSPEELHATRDVDHRADVYALGISLYELLTGKQPYQADSRPALVAQVLAGEATPIRQVRPDVPEGLAAALDRAFAKAREQRYQSVAELAAGLAPYAPLRSQGSLDRIATIAGLPPPVAGSELGQSGPSTPDHLSLKRVLAAANLPDAPPSRGQTVRASMPQHLPLLISGYEGPMSTRAAQAFAVGPSPSDLPPAAASIVITNVRPPPSRTTLLLAMAALLLLILGGSALLWTRIRAAAPPETEPAPIDRDAR